jgi:hypothetical protein
MLHEIESDPIESQPEPAAEAAPPSKPAALTGTLIQRGRDRGPRLTTLPVVEVEPAPAAAMPAAVTPSDEVPLVFAKPKWAAAPAARASRWSEALFVAACCAAFFATFLFVLRF